MPDQGPQAIVVDWFADDETIELWSRMTGQPVVRGPKPAEPAPIAHDDPVSFPSGPSGAAIVGDDNSAPAGRTTADGVSLAKILRDRPDVFQAFFTEFYGANNDHHSSAWIKRVGGTTPEDYANYWYETYGKHGEYAGAPARAPAEAIDYDRLLRDRPDVFQAAFTEYYGPNNDRNSHAWVDRVGGTTPQHYAKYWYETYGKAEGYTQRPPAAPDAPRDPGPPAAGEDDVQPPPVDDMPPTVGDDAPPPVVEEPAPPALVEDAVEDDPLVPPAQSDPDAAALPIDPGAAAPALEIPDDDGAGEVESLVKLVDPSSGFGCLLS